MVEPHKIFGRLGNSLFQYAFLYAKTKDMGIDYYVQDPKHFEKYAEDIKWLFGSDIKPIDMVSIHVRRGDYVANSFYTDLTRTDYYEKAVELFPNAEFLVFSDDLEFCKNFFIGKQYTFCEETDPIQSLNLMAGCNGHITANSSFSWWGAFLGRGKVVAPKDWYSDGEERTKCPNEWLRI